ncbi:MAG: hypothetical protein CMA71_00825 [Euryarchaeota archaeon]|nr:hypothetical protein [Euryarchaeota archaeon]
MALESGTYIDSLNASNPASTDGLGQADDHLRLIKSTIKATFPNLTGAVTATHTQLNNISSVPTDLTDLGISDGSSGQFLTTNGSGSFSFASVSQGSGGIALTDLSVGSEGVATFNGGISYNNSTGVFTYSPPTAAGIGALTAHPSISGAASSSNNSGSTFIQDITLDGNGHVTGIGTATATGMSPITGQGGGFIDDSSGTSYDNSQTATVPSGATKIHVWGNLRSGGFGANLYVQVGSTTVIQNNTNNTNVNLSNVAACSGGQTITCRLDGSGDLSVWYVFYS